jgi:hypothetical protein
MRSEFIQETKQRFIYLYKLEVMLGILQITLNL